jgi:very-short-patch-repair endonuclease
MLAGSCVTDFRVLRAALLWAGSDAAGAGRSAGAVYELEGVRAKRPDIVVERRSSPRHRTVDTSTSRDPDSLMIRVHRGLRVTGPEATLVRLGHLLGAEDLEIACEDARRRRLTTVPALGAYLDRFGAPGRPGISAVRTLLRALDPAHAARSTLEVKTRRLVVARGLGQFVREHPLEWGGHTYRFDFAYLATRTILETNGRRWHDDPADFEHDQEKWSVPGRHGLKLVLATWDKITRQPDRFVAEVRAALTA